MKTMKKVSAFLLMVVLCMSIMVMPAFATTTSQDGLEVTLTTDKETYDKGEQIEATLVVTNTNDFAVSNVSLENMIPEGYKLSEGSTATKHVESLAPGEMVSLTVTYVAVDSDNNADKPDSGDNTGDTDKPGSGNDTDSENSSGNNESSGNDEDNPQTGDNSNIALWATLMVVAAGSIVAIVMKKKSGKKLLSLFLCVTMIGAIVNGIPTKAQAADASKKDIQISTTISVDDNKFTISATVGYALTGESDFEEVPAEPTFGDIEHEIANIIELNDGEMPYTDHDENGVPNYIDGTFSNKKVTNAEDAIAALNDIHHIMQFQNAQQEFTEVYSDTIDLGSKTNYYRLQQTYHDIPVYGHQLIVSSNSEGTIQSLNGHYYPGLDVDTAPNLTIDEAKQVMKDHGASESLVSLGLCIYIDNLDSAKLCWRIKSETDIYFVCAQSGDIISGGTLVDAISEGSGYDMNGDFVNFPVSEIDGKYHLKDVVRNISVYECNLRLNDLEGTEITSLSNDPAFWSLNRDAISGYTNLIKIYDYYANVLGRDGTDNIHKPIKIHVLGCIDETHNECMNAYSLELSDYTELVILHSGGLAKALDVIGHEYTHSISRNIWLGLDTISENAVGAINEGYSDILGDLIEEEKIHLIGNMSSYGTVRDASKPKVKNMEDAESAFCTLSGTHKEHGCDNGDVHDNGTLIVNVGYQIDQNWPTSNHSDELATLFYKSMSYLTPTSTFMDCRHAVLSAAKSMNMSDEKRQVIAEAFQNVGIYHEDEEAWASAHHIIGVVRDAETNSPIIDAQVIAVATEGTGGGVGYTNGTGNYDVKVNRAKYTVSVFADGYKSFKMENVDLSSWTNMNYYMETIYLAPAEWGDGTQNVFASGKVTHALTGEPLEGVTVKFRNGAGNQTGPYVQTVAGLDIELTTDSSGQYYTAALEAGNYTLEASKDGFVTGYLNIVSGNSDVCSSQNITLTPTLSGDNFRIVLTWGENPRDLDSHVEGTLSDGRTFHVYYGHKSQYDGDVEACNLDVDDTSSYGPETITLNTTTDNPYYYYIYRFSGSGTVSSSGAQIKVYQGDNLVATFNVPTDQGNGDYWNVFAIVNGELVVQNTITSNKDTSYATTPETYNSNSFSIEENMPDKKKTASEPTENSIEDKNPVEN